MCGETNIPEEYDQMTLWKLILNMVCEPPRRTKLTNYNTLDDVVHLIKTSKKIVVLTGAGVSVSCGIPDFRSRDGVYARLAVDFPDLPDPQVPRLCLNYRFCYDRTFYRRCLTSITSERTPVLFSSLQEKFILVNLSPPHATNSSSVLKSMALCWEITHKISTPLNRWL